MRYSDLLELVVLAAIWGASFLFMRLATPDFGPVALVELRTLVAALFLLPILFAMHKAHYLWPNVGRLFIVGVSGTAIPFSLLSYATLYVTAGYASILNAATPIFSALIAWLWVREQLTLSALGGLIVGFLGVVVMSFDKQSVTAEISIIPVLAAVTATLCYGFSVNFTRHKLNHIHPLALACGSQIAASLSLIPFTLLLWPEVWPSTVAWGSGIVLGVLCTGVAFILYFRLIANVGVSRTVVVTYLIPFFGVIWGMMFIDEKVSLLMILGAGLILGGVTLTTGVLRRRG